MENNNTEVMEAEVVEVEETKKEGLMPKAGNALKKHGKKILIGAGIAAGIIAGVLIAFSASKSSKSEAIDADYEVMDDEDCSEEETEE